jgi:hypothetical protein
MEESQVYNRKEYATKDFWNDRFKATKGFFDWYTNWGHIKAFVNSLIER